jgi:hypothetical protein
MVNDMKSGIGFLIPAAGVVGFFTSLLMGDFLVSIIVAVAGILIWFLYMAVMESHIPEQMGNMIMLFGIMLAIGIFMGYGVTQNMWGGIEFQTEGSIFSLVILFFAVLTGLSFRNQSSRLATPGGGLSDSDREMVLNTIKESDKPALGAEPHVIVVKQEAASDEDEEDETDELDDPYAMMNNPYFAYPPDYYYDDEDDEDEDDEDWDDEDDEDE